MLIPNKHSGYRADGARFYPMDGGDGGGAPASQTQVSDLPDWAKPYAQKALAGAEAVTFQKDAQGNVTGLQPYQQYTGERAAQFTPLQQQAFRGAAQLGPSAAGEAGIGMAQQAAQRALGIGYDPYQTQQFRGGTAAGYMSPFIEQAMAPQLREAQRASEIQRNADQARAVASGAFGGSRQAIVEAERQRNLGMQLGDIRATGLEKAFQSAQQQFNTEQQLREQSRQYGAGLGLQGLQTALTGAGQLGQLGGQQFGQQAQALGLQQQFGTQQQQRVQDILSQQYQDFLTQQRYPYQQLEFLSSMVRGTPTGQVQTLYQPPPSALSQVAGLGTAAYGLSKAGAFADGGQVEEEPSSAGLADLAIRSMF